MSLEPAASAATPIDYRLIVLISLLLSLWLVLIDPLLDRDAILYLRSADAYLQQGLGAARQLYGRPLLSICFALLHELTGIPLVYAGLLLNSLFYALLCVGFVATVTTLGGDRRLQILAAIVILSHPVLNDQRSSILRDPAYWALSLLAFRELLLYVRKPAFRHQLRWSACILLAALFRFEGVFVALLAPFSLLACANLSHRLRHCLQLLLPQLLVIACIFLALLYQAQSATPDLLLPALETYVQRLLALPQDFRGLAEATGHALLEFTAAEDAGIAVLAGLAAILLLNICRAITWPWALLLIWGWRRRLVGQLRSDDFVLLQAQLLICLVYLAAFTLINRFMLERYTSQLVVFIALYLPFMLNSLWDAGRHSAQRYLVIALLLVMSLDSLHNLDYQKRFIADATHWLRANTPPIASLASNNQHIAYFSERRIDWDEASGNGFDLRSMLASPQLWRDKDYLVMRVKRADAVAWQAFLQNHSLSEMIVFDGGRHGRVAVVQLRGPDRRESTRTAEGES